MIPALRQTALLATLLCTAAALGGTPALANAVDAVDAADVADVAADAVDAADALGAGDAADAIAAADAVDAAGARALTAAAALAPVRLGGHDLVALDDAALDAQRGGFIGDSGLKISFGIERAVYLNGNLVTTTSLNLSELGTLSAGQAAPLTLPDVGTRVALVQSGAGNTLLTSMGPAAIGAVIQNTLDGQNIQSRTVINATVNSLSVLRSLELQRNLRSATVDALRR